MLFLDCKQDPPASGWLEPVPMRQTPENGHVDEPTPSMQATSRAHTKRAFLSRIDGFL